MKTKVPYNTDLVVELLRDTYPEEIEIIENLKKCNEGYWKSKSYIYFVSPKNANQPNAEWQFKTNIVLEHKTKGTIVLDILKGNKIGGIEFIKYID